MKNINKNYTREDYEPTNYTLRLRVCFEPLVIHWFETNTKLITYEQQKNKTKKYQKQNPQNNKEKNKNLYANLKHCRIYRFLHFVWVVLRYEFFSFILLRK